MNKILIVVMFLMGFSIISAAQTDNASLTLSGTWTLDTVHLKVYDLTTKVLLREKNLVSRDSMYRVPGVLPYVMRFVENNLVQIEGVAKNSFPGRYLIQTGDFLLWNVNTGSGSGDAVQVPSCQYRYVPNGENRMELQIKFAHKEKASGKNVVIHFAYKYSRKS